MSAHGPSGEVPHTKLPGDQAGRIYEEGFLDSESRIEGSSARQNLRLWIAVLGSAVVWFGQMQLNYSLVPWACWTGKTWVLHLSSVFFLLLAAVPGWIGFTEWTAASATGTERRSRGAGRLRFMAMLGLLSTALFILLILAQAIPTFFFDPCLE